MKNLKSYIALFIFALLAVACSKDEDAPESNLEVTANNIQGNWELSEWNGNQLAEGVYVYINFTRRDRRFTMYQNIDSFLSREIEGDYNILYEEGVGYVIRGQYDFNGEWAHRYIVKRLTSDSMTWVAQDDPDNIQVFTRCDQIPESITN